MLYVGLVFHAAEAYDMILYDTSFFLYMDIDCIYMAYAYWHVCCQYDEARSAHTHLPI